MDAIDARSLDEAETWTVSEARRRMAAPLSAQLRALASRAPFYAQKWGSDLAKRVAEATPADIERLLGELPFLTKDELRQSQEAEPPFGRHLVCDATDVARVHRTSGTTGRPLLIALSQRDARVTAVHGGRAFRSAGLRSGDIVVHCLNYCMWSGGMTDHTCLEATGAAVVPFGVGNTDELLELPKWLPFTALSCTPSYVTLLAERGTPTQLERLRQSLRLILVGGEPGGSSAPLQHLAAEVFGARVANANYGLAEVLSIFGSVCEQGDALHFHGVPTLWPELLDTTTGAVLPIEPGAQGELVLTHVVRDAQPLVRYRTNDVCEITGVDRCTCGRGGFRFELRGRADDMFVVRGINVFPHAVANALATVSPLLTEFQIHLHGPGPYDVVPLHVEIPSEDDPARVARAIERAIKLQIGCSAHVTPVAVGTLPRSEGKTPRVVRHR